MGEEKNPPTLRASITGWLDLFVKGAALFAGGFAIIQWLAAREAQRTSRALDYVEQFNDPGTAVGAARRQLTMVLWANAVQIRTLRDLLTQLPPDQAETLRTRFEYKLLDGAPDDPARVNLHTVVQFFDAVFVCTDANLCDDDATFAFFASYAETLWSNFGRTVRENRDLAPDYGHGLEAFVEAIEARRQGTVDKGGL